MNLKKKILCGVLASSFVFGGLVSGAQTFAMIEESAAPSATATIVDPSVNTPDERGRTPLINALEDYNVEAVRELLAKGASLEIPSEYWNYYYSELCPHILTTPSPYQVNRDIMKGRELFANVFELFCSQAVARHWACNRDYGTYDGWLRRDINKRAELAPKAKEIAEIILKHCVEKGIHLNVNPDVFSLNKIGRCRVEHTLVLDVGVKKTLKRYKAEHGDLFTFEPGGELFFVMDGEIFILYRKGDELFYASAQKQDGDCL